MNNNKRTYNKKNQRYNIAKKGNNSPPMQSSGFNLQNIGQLSTLNDNIYNYISNGQSRNYMGNVKKTITLKNNRNEQIVITEEHNFVNTLPGGSMCIERSSGKRAMKKI